MKALAGPTRASQKMSAENLFIAYWVVIENHSVGQQLKTDVDLGSEEEDLEWEFE